ncbi:phosphate ABC transporter permease subunit PstC [Limosilactobacillus fermentum]|uniref:phosphate ABC transporter permease subunit PstC n=1 Tax=Limosilactobacillus fermentum TaxID=1613 RepID=UPI0021A5E7DA|nr:phosphate ABC transporter permease subunit PstC [Limosilactobacillus fermentum]MCT3456504.1 phosphate ABC transporter permease subunit PstC [Limosilactobacillus fermentum]
MNDWEKRLTGPSKETNQERLGRVLTTLSITVIGLLVVTILVFLASKGLSLFFKYGVNVWDFLSGTNWSPKKGFYGALPMIVTSFGVTMMAGVVALPLALMVALAVTEILPATFRKVTQPVIELLVGIPSVVYGFVGLTVIIPVLRQWFGGTGFGMLAATVVLFLMIVPTMVSMTIDTLLAVPESYRMASRGLGATRWQTIYRTILPSATGGVLTAMIFGMARAFGEALAVQMVVGNASIMPTSLMSSAATLTSVLTTGIGNTVMGTAANDALWSLALVLLVMSLFFNLAMRLVNRNKEG